MLLPHSNVTWAPWCLKSTAAQMFVEQVVQTIKGNIKAPSYWPFVRGIHQWMVDSPHKGPVTQKVFPLYDAVLHIFQTIDRTSCPDGEKSMGYGSWFSIPKQRSDRTCVLERVVTIGLDSWNLNRSMSCSSKILPADTPFGDLEFHICLT